MITLNLDLNAGTLKLSQTTVVKYGSVIPVQVIFASAPGTLTGIELALGDDSSSPTVLAFTDVFSPYSDTTWSGVLNTFTNPMGQFIGGKSAASVDLELTVIVDGNRTVMPNVSLTVQQLINNGGTALTVGQTYYTQSEVDGLLATRAALTVAGHYRISPNGSLELWNPTQNKWHSITIAGAAGAEVLQIGSGEN